TVDADRGAGAAQVPASDELGAKHGAEPGAGRRVELGVMSRPTARFVATGGETLHEVVERSSAGAIGEGRVFVDGRRVTNGDVRLAAGSVVEIYARREEDAVGALRVLRRVGGLVFVDKPA